MLIWSVLYALIKYVVLILIVFPFSFYGSCLHLSLLERSSTREFLEPRWTIPQING